MKYLVSAMVFFIAIGILFYFDKKRTQQKRLQMQKMRNSKMYEDLYPFIRRLRRRRIEEILISSEQVEFLILLPVRRKIVFSFAMHKHADLSNHKVYILCLLLQQDIPVLRDKSRYHLKRNHFEGKNGEPIHTYTYTMKTAYKDALCRNPIYSPYFSK